MVGRKLTGGEKTGFLNSKRRNIYMSGNGRYFANSDGGKRVYSPKARFISVNGAVRAITARNVIPNKIRPARSAMHPENAKAHRKERAYVRSRAIVPYVSNQNVLAAQALTALKAPRGKSRFSSLAGLAGSGTSRFNALVNAAARAESPSSFASYPIRSPSAWSESPDSTVYNAVAMRKMYKEPTARKPRAQGAVLNDVALRGLFGGKVYSGKYKTDEERREARRTAARRYYEKKKAGRA
jgi:hypothetical protein